jgi:hypothetical protein
MSQSDDADLDDTHDQDWDGTRADRLISRIVDRSAAPEDWSGFASLARSEPSHWEQLLTTLRADAALRSALGGPLAVADRVETRAPVTVLASWRRWSGWAAAAMLAAAWVGSLAAPTPASAPRDVAPATSQLAGHQATPGPAGAAHVPTPLGQPIRGTPVMEELPLRLVGTRPGPDGRGVEVLYVRPIVEKAVVDNVFSFSTDELGRPTPVSVDPALLVASNSQL